MRKIYVTSDNHFLQESFLTFKDQNGNKIRNFSSIEEIDELMIENWNKTVNPKDIIYHLGDVYIGNKEKADNILSRLNGRKRLILGNHDDGKDKILTKHFEKIMVERMFPEYGVILSHRPLHPDGLFIYKSQKYLTNMHGHLHNNVINDSRYVNVSVEQTNYTPVDIETFANKETK
jgi:calcineurin-like phosphoesterase family protein